MDDLRDNRPISGYTPPPRPAAAAATMTFAGLWRELADVAARNRTLLAVAAGGLVLADVVVTLAAGERAANTLGNILSLIVIYLLTREMLRAEKLIENEGGFGSYFLASLLAGLGVIGGFILLIVPGLYLLARWALAPTLTIARALPGVDAMKESWGRTGDVAWLLVGFYVVAFLMLLVIAFFAGVLGGLLDGGTGTVTIVLTSVVANAFVALSAALSIAIYRLLAGSANTIRDVFE